MRSLVGVGRKSCPHFLLEVSVKTSALIAVLTVAAATTGASSCATPTLPTVRAVDANRYEAAFKFECGGVDTFAVGTAECQYQEGDKMRLKVKVPDSPGEIQIRSCRRGRALDIDTGGTWQEVEWVQYTREDSCPIVFSVATKDAGVQLGKIYPYVSGGAYPKLFGKGRMYCWESEQVIDFEGQLSCQVPTGIKVTGYVIPNASKAGTYLIVSPCLQGTLGGVFSVGTDPIKWSLISGAPQFCPVSAAIKYADGSYEELEYYLDFFDNTYSMLPPPVMGEYKDSSYACAPQDFLFFDLNDRQKGRGLFAGKCIKGGWLEGDLAVGIAWDASGRSSYSLATKKGTTWNREMILSNNLKLKLKAKQSPVTR